MKTKATATTIMTTTTTNNNIRSRYLVNYIRDVQQASKGTAAQYEYRLLKFEKYVVTKAGSEEERQKRQQQQYQELMISRGKDEDI